MTVRDVLTALYEEHGTLTADLVVAAAADAASPLHEHFVWDDAEAGHQYRLEQARLLIRTVRVQIVSPKHPDRTMRVRHFTHTTLGGDRKYVPQSVIVGEPELREHVRQRMLREWRQLKIRYEAHEEFWALLAGELACRESKDDAA